MLHCFSLFYDDIVILEDVVKDNIDEGKSAVFFRWVVENLPDPKPQFGKFTLSSLHP